MRLATIHEGDLIKCDVRGRRFLANVERVEPDGCVRITPIDRRISYRHVKARQVLVLIRRAVRHQPDPQIPGQLQMPWGGAR